MQTPFDKAGPWDVVLEVFRTVRDVARFAAQSGKVRRKALEAVRDEIEQAAKELDAGKLHRVLRDPGRRVQDHAEAKSGGGSGPDPDAGGDRG